MQFLQTFWTGPSSQRPANLIPMKGGWRSCEYHWMSWALSCLQAEKVFGSINLVTDFAGREILVDRLQLPYTSVSTALETILDHCDPRLWALAKIYTYGLQEEPFLHLDGDVFLWHKPSDEFLQSPLIAQNQDKDLPMYGLMLAQINEHFSFVPEFFEKPRYENTAVYASNAGLLGGHNLAVIKKYRNQAFEFIEKNKDHLDKLPTGNLNFIFEQYLFCQLAAAEGVEISYLNGVVDNPVFKDYIKFEDFPETPIVHPVGGFKKYPHVCEHVAKILRNDYPEYYYRIIEMVRDSETSMRSAIYYLPELQLKTLPTSPLTNGTKLPPFKRANIALNYFGNKYKLANNDELSENTDKAAYLSHAAFDVADEHERQCLLDIIHLDANHSELAKHFFANGQSVTQLYQDDADAYKQIRHFFSLPGDEIGEFYIQKHLHTTLIESGWAWDHNYDEEIPLVIEKNLKEAKGAYTIALTPDIISTTIKEYYLDDLDEIILSIAENKVKVNSVIQQVEECFDEDEIKENYESYKRLIINSIRHLLYAGILEILKE